MRQAPRAPGVAPAAPSTARPGSPRRGPPGWRTLETPRRAGAAIDAGAGGSQVILLDCLSMLAGNVFAACGEDLAAGESALAEEVDALIAAQERSSAAWIVVSNEVGIQGEPTFLITAERADSLERMVVRRDRCKSPALPRLLP